MQETAGKKREVSWKRIGCDTTTFSISASLLSSHKDGGNWRARAPCLHTAFIRWRNKKGHNQVDSRTIQNSNSLLYYVLNKVTYHAHNTPPNNINIMNQDSFEGITYIHLPPPASPKSTSWSSTASAKSFCAFGPMRPTTLAKLRHFFFRRFVWLQLLKSASLFHGRVIG